MLEITPNLSILNQYKLMRVQEKKKGLKRKEKLLKRKLRLKARKRIQAWLYRQAFELANKKIQLGLANKLKKVI